MSARRALAAPAALTLAVGAALLPTAAGTANAASSTMLGSTLTQLNGSGVTSTVTAELEGTQLTVNIKSKGLLAGAPHAQHIHIGGSHTCPATGAKGKGANGALQVSDAAGNYGDIAVSLTTTGDTSPSSGLSVDRLPVGDASYSRTLTLTQAQADSIKNNEGVIVQHGVDLNGSGTYDGDTKSDLDPTLPEEATDPSSCGVLKVMAAGSAATGGGSTTGTQDTALFVGGGAMVALGGVALVALRRRRQGA